MKAGIDPDKPGEEPPTRSTWFVTPLVWLAIAALSLIVAPNWPF